MNVCASRSIPSPQCTFGCGTFERFCTTSQFWTTSFSPFRSGKLPSGHARFVEPRFRYCANSASDPRLPTGRPQPPFTSVVVPSFLYGPPGMYCPTCVLMKGSNTPSFNTRFTTPAIASEPYCVEAPSRSTSTRSIALDGNAFRSTPLEPGADPLENTLSSDV